MNQTFKLEYPIDLSKDGKDLITEVTLGRLKARDMREASAKKSNGFEFSHFIISKSTGLSMLEIDEMDAADYDGLVDAITPFLSRGS